MAYLAEPLSARYGLTRRAVRPHDELDGPAQIVCEGLRPDGASRPLDVGVQFRLSTGKSNGPLSGGPALYAVTAMADYAATGTLSSPMATCPVAVHVNGQAIWSVLEPVLQRHLRLALEVPGHLLQLGHRPPRRF